MLIILEGLDKTGKTTLAQEIAELIGAEVRHCDKPYRHPLEEYQSDLDDYVPGSGKHIVYDRHCWGERVWPNVYNRRSQYTVGMHHHTELFLMSRGAQFVHCSASGQLIVERLIADDDPLPPHDRVPFALWSFRDVESRSLLRRHTLHYDFTEVNHPTADSIVMHAENMERQVAEAPSWHWVGDPYPGLLLVGETPGVRYPEQAAAPFRPYADTAGAYLMRVMAGSEEIAVTNGWDGQGAPVPLRPLWIFLETPAVVALGNRAHEALMMADVPHGVVPHPQWVRRFHHRKTQEYAELITTAAGRDLDMRGVARGWQTSTP